MGTDDDRRVADRRSPGDGTTPRWVGRAGQTANGRPHQTRHPAGQTGRREPLRPVEGASAALVLPRAPGRTSQPPTSARRRPPPRRDRRPWRARPEVGSPRHTPGMAAPAGAASVSPRRATSGTTPPASLIGRLSPSNRRQPCRRAPPIAHRGTIPRGAAGRPPLPPSTPGIDHRTRLRRLLIVDQSRGRAWTAGGTVLLCRSPACGAGPLRPAGRRHRHVRCRASTMRSSPTVTAWQQGDCSS